MSEPDLAKLLWDDPEFVARWQSAEAEWFAELFRTGSYRGERGPKLPGIEVFTIARDAMDDNAPLKIMTGTEYGDYVVPVEHVAFKMYPAVEKTHLASPPRNGIINRHNRRKAAKLNRGK